MSLLSAAFIVAIILVVVFSWMRLRSDLRDIRSMQADRQKSADSLDFESAEPSDGSLHQHSGHDGGHAGCDTGDHHSGDCGHGFDGGHFDGGGHH